MTLFLLLFLGYYANCQGLQDSVLKSALHDTICTGERIHYGTHGYTWPDKQYFTGTWNYFPQTDMRADGTIWDMYSNSVRYYPYEEGESACSIQIEHCMPKSWWGSEAANKRAYQDLFNLNPADARANGKKSNYPPGIVTHADNFDNGSFRMDSKSKSQYGWACFEPADEYKGDFARTYFYMATAYEDVAWVSGTTPFNAANAMTNDSYLEFQPWLMDLLVAWHRADPVSPKEILRASLITSVQGNHNPYIDYPELVEYIWGNRRGQQVDFNTLVCTYDSTLLPPERPCPPVGDYDTLISILGMTSDRVKAAGGTVSEKVQSNGTRSFTMGTSGTDGYLTFPSLNYADSTLLVFRASPYNTAGDMRIDIEADDEWVATIRDTARLETRNEVIYRVPLPPLTSLKITSDGGSTARRACLQELYVLRPHRQPTALIVPGEQQPLRITKQLINGHLYILRGDDKYSITGMKY